MKEDRIIRQLDKMVAAGRVTREEAPRLREAEGTADFDAAIAGIRARHAGAHLAGAVRSGDMSQEEADAYLERLYQGEHPKGLRARLAKHRSEEH